MTYIWKMTIAMMVAHLFTASAAPAAPARIDATFSFFRVGASDFESSSFSGLGDVNFSPPSEPGFLGSVSFDIIDGDIRAAGTFFRFCGDPPFCGPGDAGFRYEDPIISTGNLFTQLGLFLEPPGFFGAEFAGPFSGGPGIVIQVAFVSGTATLVPEPSAFVLLTSAIAALGAIGVKRRRSA
jgi:hypothetical protein